ncbi:glycoside hydrolase family 108 protein [Caulobacter segnis]|uniref:Uncharacterized protein n=1 Tax=Caulobacter segnis TaxID=88688 RepID=A0A2W5VA76_9CAUL|nr:glycosyl hydrolase 108 family protein [Caulobacter segnis]PZR32275.1 MAG: hypothetical protein DI526_17015 [Caulobacter segnis]
MNANTPVSVLLPTSVALPDGWTPAHSERWKRIFAKLLKSEGGYVNNRKDPGGATKYGISLRFLVIEGRIDANRDGFADFDLNRDGKIDALDIQLLRPEHAEALYLRLFFIETGFWRLPEAMDAALFDLGVNVGTKTAVIILQRSLNRLGPPPLATDGVLGGKTLRRVFEGLASAPLLRSFRDEAAAHYRFLVGRNGELKGFLDGWLNRARELGRVG